MESDAEKGIPTKDEKMAKRAQDDHINDLHDKLSKKTKMD